MPAVLELGVGLREHERHLGVVAHRDPHLVAADHPAAVVGAPRARLLVGGVRAGVGLGEAEAAQPLAAAELGQVLLLLLLGAPLQDRRAHERGLDRHDRAHRGVSPPDLLHDQAVGHVVEARAAVLPRHDRAQVALLGDLAHELDVEVVVAVVLAPAGDDLVVGEVPRRLADQLLLVAQVEVHGDGILGSREAGGRQSLATVHVLLDSPDLPPSRVHTWASSMSSGSPLWRRGPSCEPTRTPGPRSRGSRRARP